MGVQLTHTELFEQSNVIIADAKALAASPDANAESQAKVLLMIEDAKGLRTRSKALAELEAMVVEEQPAVEKAAVKQVIGTPGLKVSPFRSFGEYLTAIWNTTKFNQWDPRLKASTIKFPDDPSPAFDTQKQGWMGEAKVMTEAVGADGGFTVFPEYRSNLFQLSEFTRYAVSYTHLTLPTILLV